MNNFIHFYEGSWFFWDETLSHRYGPYKTEGEALDGFYLYCDYLDKEGWDDNKILATTNWDLIIAVVLGIAIMGILVWSAI